MEVPEDEAADRGGPQRRRGRKRSTDERRCAPVPQGVRGQRPQSGLAPPERAAKRGRRDRGHDALAHQGAGASTATHSAPTPTPKDTARRRRGDSKTADCVWTDRPESSVVWDSIIDWYCNYYASKKPHFGANEQERQDGKDIEWIVRPGADPGPLYGADDDELDKEFASALVSLGLSCRMLYERVGAANVRIDALRSSFMETHDDEPQTEVMATSLYVRGRGTRERGIDLVFDTQMRFIARHRTDDYEARYEARSSRLCGAPLAAPMIENGAVKDASDNEEGNDETKRPAHLRFQLIVPIINEVRIEWTEINDRDGGGGKWHGGCDDDDDDDYICASDTEDDESPRTPAGPDGVWRIKAGDGSEWEMRIHNNKRQGCIVREVMVRTH